MDKTQRKTIGSIRLTPKKNKVLDKTKKSCTLRQATLTTIKMWIKDFLRGKCQKVYGYKIPLVANWK